MAITSFKPSVWETALITAFRGISVTNMITTAPTRVEGEKAIFNSVSGGTIKDYVPGTTSIEYDAASTTGIELPYDKKKYFALSIDDCDAVQAAGPVLTVLAQEKAYDIKEAIDTDVLAAMATAAVGKIGTTAAKKEITKASEAYDYVVDLGTLLSKKKVPIANRFVVASAEFINLMAKDSRFSSNFNVLPTGIVQGATINGMTIIQCEEAPAGAVLAVHKSAFGFGEQINNVEAIRLQGSFSDAVRGLVQYGKVALRANGIAVLYYSIGTTAA